MRVKAQVVLSSDHYVYVKPLIKITAVLYIGLPLYSGLVF